MNTDFKISDTLTYENEIRIYQDHGNSNYSSLFRMFNENEDWKAEFYEHFAKVDETSEMHTSKTSLSTEKDLDYIYLMFNVNYLYELPSLSDIQWKLDTRFIEKEKEHTYRGKVIKEKYYLVISTVSVLDGESYKVQLRNTDVLREFQYSNPRSYLKNYPDIDELIFINEILDIVKNEFQIWLD